LENNIRAIIAVFQLSARVKRVQVVRKKSLLVLFANYQFPLVMLLGNAAFVEQRDI